MDTIKHDLVPKHIKLSDTQKEELLKQFNITLYELPKIRKDDAAIRDLKLKPGDVVKIVRKSPTAGESVFYRTVIN